MNPNFAETLAPAVGYASATFTVSTAAIATPTTYDITKVPFVWVEIQTNGVYSRFDGTNPTAAAGGGHLFPATYRDVWSTQRYNACKWIRSGAADAVVFVTPLSC